MFVFISTMIIGTSQGTKGNYCVTVFAVSPSTCVSPQRITYHSEHHSTNNYYQIQNHLIQYFVLLRKKSNKPQISRTILKDKKIKEYNNSHQLYL